MGISVGWGDEYEYYLAWQWVDITNVPAGRYTVRATVDPYGFFTELKETNQCAWARVRFGATGSSVAVEASGRTCVNDIGDSIFANDIAWAYDDGITVGCAPNLFCTNSRVTREQMASFLARALHLAGDVNRLLRRRQGIPARRGHQPRRGGRHHGRLRHEPVLSAQRR